MTLHDRIMALPKRTPGEYDVVVKAASMATEADELMAEMAEEHSAAMHEAGELMKLMADELGCYADNPETREVLDVYNEYKESTK